MCPGETEGGKIRKGGRKDGRAFVDLKTRAQLPAVSFLCEHEQAI